MPPGIDQLTAAPMVLESGGRKLRLSPLTLGDIGELQKWIHSQLPDPVPLARELAEGMPPEVQIEILRDAFKHRMAAQRSHLLGTTEADAMIGTMQGFLEITYLMARENHPELVRDALTPLLGGLGPDRIGDIVAHAFGIVRTADDLMPAGSVGPKARAGANDVPGPSTSAASCETSSAAGDSPPT